MSLKLNALAFGALLLCLACSESNKTSENTNNKDTVDSTETKDKTSDDKVGSLAAILEEKKNAWAANAPEDRKKLYEAGIQEVKASGLLEKALNIGEKAPDFALKNAKGQLVKLSDYTQKGPVVLTWYRGGWCPYCNLTLRELQRLLPEFKALNASLLALTPELPDKSLSTTEKNELQFEVLSDIDNKVAKTYNIVFELYKPIQEGFKKLEDYNGNNTYELPLAATYIIDQKGYIQYAFIDADYRKRAEPSELLNFIQQMKE